MRRLKRWLGGGQSSAPADSQPCIHESPALPSPEQSRFSHDDLRMLENVAEIIARAASSASTHQSPKTVASSDPIVISMSAPPSCDTLARTRQPLAAMAQSYSPSTPTDSPLRRSCSDISLSRRSSGTQNVINHCIVREKMHGYSVASSFEQRAALQDYRTRIKLATISGYQDSERVSPDKSDI